MECIVKRLEKCIAYKAAKRWRVLSVALATGVILCVLFSDLNVPAQGTKEDRNAGSTDLQGATVADFPDGEYSIEVSLTGGSGKAFVSSPTWVDIIDGRAYARLLWSSPYYDYMIVDGKKYPNETKDGGNSVFTIPITAFDSAIPIVADTTAMGHPIEIGYELVFYRGSIGDKGMVPQEAARKVLLMAAVIIVAGAVLNFFVRKHRG